MNLITAINLHSNFRNFDPVPIDNRSCTAAF